MKVDVRQLYINGAGHEYPDEEASYRQVSWNPIVAKKLLIYEFFGRRIPK
ncbi:MAG: hypothetical protein IKP02_04180 [Paludibacteraceae bacterium]|nr:hypothetical protein [Paludibacteraceae bacterium]